MRMCEFVHEWCVSRTTQTGEFVCFSPVASACGNWFVVVARPAHFVRGFRAIALLAQCALVERCFLSSVVNGI